MKRAGIFALLAAMLCASSIVPAAEPQPPNATVEEPRAFGYVVGDIATQRVLLELQGQPFTPASLPASGPLGNWVERHAARIERDTRGRQWLAVEYQIMNSPQELKAVTIPAWRLTGKNPNTELRVPEWQISVGPLTPEQAFAETGLGALRPDRAAPLIDLAPTQRWLTIWAATAIVLLLAWIAWWAWRNWQASSRRPFARAVRELRGIDEQSPEAWYSVHRAIDATAGRVVHRETMAVLFERAPQFAPQRPAIERFLDASMARFFGVSAPASSAQPPLSLRALCAELRRIEKRYET
jgi:mxaA protein